MKGEIGALQASVTPLRFMRACGIFIIGAEWKIMTLIRRFALPSPQGGRQKGTIICMFASKAAYAPRGRVKVVTSLRER